MENVSHGVSLIPRGATFKKYSTRLFLQISGLYMYIFICLDQGVMNKILAMEELSITVCKWEDFQFFQ